MSYGPERHWDYDLMRRVRALCACADSGLSRPVLTCVSVEGEGLVATDSFILGWLRDEPFVLWSTGSFLVSAAALKRALTGIAAADVRIVADGSDPISIEIRQQSKDRHADATVNVPFIDPGRFPDWRPLVPEPREQARHDPVEPWFNYRHLARLGALAPDAGPEVNPVRIVSTSVLRPARVEHSDGSLLGIAMPVRWDPSAKKEGT